MRSHSPASFSKQSTMAVVLIYGTCPRGNLSTSTRSILCPSHPSFKQHIMTAPPHEEEADLSLCVALPRHRNHRPNRDVFHQSFHRPPLSTPISPAWHGNHAYLVEVGKFLRAYLGPGRTLCRKTYMFARAGSFRSTQIYCTPEMPATTC